MMSPFFAGVFLFLCLAAPLAAQQTSPAGALPSLADLERLKFEEVDALPTGVPSYADLRSALELLENYRHGAASLSESPPAPRTRGATRAMVHNRACEAVVFIQAPVRFEEGRPVKWTSGAGVMLHPDADILTNWHVVREADEGKHPLVAFLKPRGETARFAFAVEVIDLDPAKDLALLRFVRMPPFRLVTLRLGDLSRVYVGQDIYAVGHPQGTRNAWSYTTGVVSQLRRNYQTRLKEGKNFSQLVLADVVQIQARINPGDSGGVVLDDRGKLLGLLAFGGGENLHFAIAADEISAFLHRSGDSQFGLRGTTSYSSQLENYSAAGAANGRRIFRMRFPDVTAYVVQQTDGRLAGLVASWSGGAVVQAWGPDKSGGFNHWVGWFADGAAAEASGRDGKPVRFGPL